MVEIDEMQSRFMPELGTLVHRFDENVDDEDEDEGDRGDRGGWFQMYVANGNNRCYMKRLITGGHGITIRQNVIKAGLH